MEVYTSLNLSDNRHLFAFKSDNFDFVIFDLFYNLENCFKADDDTKTKEFITYGKNTKTFAFYAEPLSDNRVAMFYGDYKSTNGLIYFAILQYTWNKRKIFSILKDNPFPGIFPVTSSSRFIFNNTLIFPRNQQQLIEIYDFNEGNLEIRKTISSNLFSTVHWNVIEDVMYSFKMDDDNLNSTLLGTTSLNDQNGIDYRTIFGHFDARWFEYTEFMAAWHLDRFYAVVTCKNIGTRTILLDIQSLQWTELSVSKFTMGLGSRLNYGDFLLTSSSSFILNFELNKGRCRKTYSGRVPMRLTFGKPNSLLFLTFMNLKKLKEMRTLLQKNPKLYQNSNSLDNYTISLNDNLWSLIVKLCCPKSKKPLIQNLTPTRLSARKRRNSGCECRVCIAG